MYQLSHLLTEQRSLLATLAHTQIVEGVAPVNTSVASSNPEQDKDAENRKQLSDIMQKVLWLIFKILRGNVLGVTPGVSTWNSQWDGEYYIFKSSQKKFIEANHPYLVSLITFTLKRL